MFTLDAKLGIPSSTPKFYVTSEVSNYILSYLTANETAIEKRLHTQKLPYKEIWIELEIEETTVSRGTATTKMGALIREDTPIEWSSSLVWQDDKGGAQGNPFSIVYDIKNNHNFFHNKFLRQKRGYRKITWPDDSSSLSKHARLLLWEDGMRKADYKRLEQFFFGKRYLYDMDSETQNYITTMSFAAYTFFSILITSNDLLSNNLLGKETIPGPAAQREGNPIVGDSAHVVKLSLQPGTRTISNSKICNDGTPQREHVRRGHQRIYGECTNGVQERSNLCDERETSTDKRYYCGICFKRITKVDSYKAGRNKLGKIVRTYELGLNDING